MWKCAQCIDRRTLLAASPGHSGCQPRPMRCRRGARGHLKARSSFQLRSFMQMKSRFTLHLQRWSLAVGSQARRRVRVEPERIAAPLP